MNYHPTITYMLRAPFDSLDYSEVHMKRQGFDDDKGVWVIGDVHGCYETLKLLLSHLPDDANICFTGDLIDRGPRSMEVLDLVMKKGYDCVLGNHELMMLGSLEIEKSHGEIGVHAPLWCYPTFMKHGGMITIKSFGVEVYELDKIPNKYVQWMMGLPLYIKYPIYDEKGQELLVSHSCVGQHTTLADAACNLWWQEGLLWRRGFHKIPTGYYHIFGHSPSSKEPTVKRNHACIDTGCVFVEDEGRLTAMHYPSKRIIQVNNIEIKEREDD